MSDLALTGLAGSHPLGALAAFGLLRCCDRIDALGPVRMYWKREADWFAVLKTAQPVTGDDLVALLSERVRGSPERPELAWSDNIKTSPKAFRDAARQATEQAIPGSRDFADFLAAFGCDLATNRKGEIEPMAFYMTSGQQKFLKEVRGLKGSLRAGVSVNRRKKKTTEMFQEALFGPWRYEDPQHSLGWDPSTERLHALRSKSPTKEAPQGVTAAVWLAYEALPLFPCFLSGGRLATRGFGRTGDRVEFSWPVWTEPASLATARSLLAMGELTQEKPCLAELRERGVAAVFRSERYRVKTQGSYFIFRPASPCS